MNRREFIKCTSVAICMPTGELGAKQDALDGKVIWSGQDHRGRPIRIVYFKNPLPTEIHDGMTGERVKYISRVGVETQWRKDLLGNPCWSPAGLSELPETFWDKVIPVLLND